jgi:hypothetical protein
VTEGHRKLTPEQQKAMERIQLAGVLLLIVVMVTMNVLARSDVIDTWKLLVIGFAAMIALVMIAGLAVSRVEARPFGDVMRDLFRASRADLKSAPARLRRRVGDTLSRRRSR